MLFLLPQTIVIEVSLYCCDKVANFCTNTHKPELHLLSFGCFFNSILNKKWPNDNKYNSGMCVFVPKFATLTQYNETSIAIVCNG